MGNAITLQDIATNAGVSKSTVSFVMQGSPLVAEATRKRFKSLHKDLDMFITEPLQVFAADKREILDLLLAASATHSSLS